jgi:diguanylate cyclase (GGDEF)-like protein
MKKIWWSKQGVLGLIVSVILGFSIFWVVNHNMHQKARLQFSNDAQVLASSISANLNNYINVLTGLRALVVNPVNIHDFEIYNQNLNDVGQLPALNSTFYMTDTEHFLGYNQASHVLFNFNNLDKKVQEHIWLHLNKNKQNTYHTSEALPHQSLKESAILFFDGKMLITYPVYEENDGVYRYHGEVGIILNLNKDLFSVPSSELQQLGYEIIYNFNNLVLFKNGVIDNQPYFEMPVFIKDNGNYLKLRLFITPNHPLLNNNQDAIILAFALGWSIYFFILVLISLNHSNEEAVKIATEMTEELRYSAWYDPLTGLYNRLKITEELDKMIEHNLFPDLAIICMDIENFKRINDTIGHEKGDEILKGYATRLKSFDAVLCAARISADEFITIIQLESHEHKNLLETIEKLKIVMEVPFKMGEELFFVKNHMGIALLPNHTQNATSLIKFAELAMYEAKNSTSHLVVYEDNLSDKLKYQNQLTSALSQALDNNEFYLVYQPKIVYTAEGIRCKGAEVLCRWTNAELGRIPPDVFIPLAEQSGEIHRLGQWVMEQAASRLALWKQDNPKMLLSINLSPCQFMNPQIPYEYKKILEQNHLVPDDVVLEITETSMMLDRQQSIEILDVFYQQGFTISIDDFGKGHSSLSYLKDFPVSEIKMDKGFIDNIVSNSFDQILVEGIVSMTKKLGLDLVVEGVETPEQVKWLHQAGCHIFQGYYFAHPLKADEFESFLNINKI